MIRLVIACSSCALILALAAPSPLRAECSPVRGDIAPGAMDDLTVPPTWWVEGDLTLTVGDAVVAMRSAVHLQQVRWQEPVSPSCPQQAGDVSPGTLDPMTMAWTPIGDGSLDLGDVIIILRAATGLISIEEPGPFLTYYRDAKVILDDRCVRCHEAAGAGIAPFGLSSWDEIAALGLDVDPDWMGNALISGEMPPWPPSESCNSFKNSRALTPDDLATLLQWLDDGARQGDPADEPPPRDPPPVISYDLSLQMAAPYLPPTNQSDFYRCFVMEWPEPATTFVTGMQLRPDAVEQVHHAIAYSATGADADQARALDGADGDPGYTCWGGPIVNAGWISAWVPGATGGAFPENTGIRVNPGGVIVLQMHYNMDYVAPAFDQSSIDLRLAPSVAREAQVLLPGVFDFLIPAGAPAHQDSQTYPAFLLGGAGVIHVSGLHMHQLGTSASLTLNRAAGGSECLLDIPAWDFHWQDSYEHETAVNVGVNDSITLRCQWDNSPANQPYVGGVQQAPRDVTWGDNSTDEMCLGILYVTAP